MPSLGELSKMLQDATSTLSEVERALAADPTSESLRLMVRSMRTSQQELEATFLSEVDSLGIDVCSYRFFSPISEQLNIGSLGRALDSFQTLISNVFAAVRTRAPRGSSNLSADAIAESSLQFGYTFAGSVGFVLTVPNERRLFGDSALDEAINTVFDMAKAETPSDVAAFAERLGSPSVRALYRWARTHSLSGIGADLEWRRQDNIRGALFMQLPDLDHLTSTIEATSDATTLEVPLSGMLVGLQQERRTFDMAFEDGSHIHGTIGDELMSSISLDNPLAIPARYFVRLTKTTRTRYSMDEDEESWVLDGIERT
ncbi:MAG TPA: hypothetical protein VI759_05010 [Dehalococcoidia bacterium]|nr:hypothetical protein [Dehalococcoidia bacterium]